ncbi:rod shape-determining protein [Mycoplasmatota bacterium]|nr:rod shape-determining protein [Mycoplasmatota bacterium]
MEKSILKIGIDLGTSNTLIYSSGRGVVYNEPTVVAFDKNTGKIIAVGTEAKVMLGKTHDKINVVRPIEQGVIADKDSTIKMLDYILEHNVKQFENINPKKTVVLVCCHSDLSSIERKALKDIITDFGLDNVFVQEEVKAGAIGAGIDIYTPEGSMIIDIGGGSTDVGVLALGDIVVSKSIKVAGNYFDKEIKKYIKKKHNFEIGLLTAEQVKIALATLRDELKEEKEISVAGRDLKRGLPSRIVIKQSEVRDVLKRCLGSIANQILKVLEVTPPEIAADIIDSGVILNGGGALIDGLSEYLEDLCQLDIKISPEPLTAIVKGTKDLLKNRGDYLVAPSD